MDGAGGGGVWSNGGNGGAGIVDVNPATGTAGAITP